MMALGHMLKAARLNLSQVWDQLSSIGTDTGLPFNLQNYQHAV
jgi:hypothetical protein